MPREIELAATRSPLTAARPGAATRPYIEALVALALAAAATERVRLGTAVLVLPLRNPVMFAKQAASIDAASRGRLELGLGAGWLAEEFDALNVTVRTPRRPAGRVDRDRARVLDRVSRPRAAPRITSCRRTRSACRRQHTRSRSCSAATRHGARVAPARSPTAGSGQQSAPELDPQPIAEARTRHRSRARRPGATASAIRTVLRIVESAGRAETRRQGAAVAGERRSRRGHRRSDLGGGRSGRAARACCVPRRSPRERRGHDLPHRQARAGHRRRQRDSAPRSSSASHEAGATGASST